MKTKFFSVLLLLVLVAGCASGLTPDQKLNRWAMAAQQAAKIGAMADLQRHPEHREAYAASVAMLAAVTDPTQLAAALDALPIRQLHGPDGTIVISSVVLLYDVAAIEFAIEAPASARLFATRIALGFREALNTYPKAFPELTP